MEFIGATLILGSIVLIIVSFLFSKNQEQVLQDKIEQEQLDNLQEMALPLEKKLRDAIYDCKRNIALCDKQIQVICKDQLDVLQDLGKKSHIEVKGKPLFFEFHNPVSGERHFYYERDLSKNVEPQVLEDSQKVAQKYAKHIELLLTQKELFEKLIESHNENLERISGVKNQNAQVDKIKIHQEKLSDLSQENKLEEKAIYGKMLISGINEELEHQEECLRQYIELNQKYDNTLDENVKQKIQIQIQEIIEQLEDEDPSSL